MPSSKKFTCKGTLQQVFICLRPPPLLWSYGVGSARSRNFLGSESGQIQRIKLLQVSNRTQHPHSLSAHILLYFTQGRGGVGGELNKREG